MNNKKLISAIAIASILILSGCANNPDEANRSITTNEIIDNSESSKSESSIVESSSEPLIYPFEPEINLNQTYKLDDEEYINSLKTTADYMNKLSADIIACNSDSPNLMISGFSAYNAVSLLAKYATGETADEFKAVLGDVDLYALDYCKQNMPIETANMFIIDNDLKLNTPDISTFIFQDLQNASIVEFINDFTNRVSHGMIPSMINSPFEQETKAAILDSIYFKGLWTNKFETINPQTFYGKTKEIETDFMSATADFKHDASKHIISLDYKNSDLAMDICYDIGSDTVSTIFDNYVTDLNTIDNNLTLQTIKLTMPKFSIESDFDLKSSYKKAGLTKIFDPIYSNNLIKLANDLYISDAKQKTKLIVDEEGTEASATTIIDVKNDAIMEPIEPIEITINKPFTYAIREKTTNIILFAGYVNDLT